MRAISELRQDMVTGDWIVVATGRAKRPDQFLKRENREHVQPKTDCPFERLMPDAYAVYDAGGKPLSLSGNAREGSEKKWSLQVVPNKYPAFGHGVCALMRHAGPYAFQDGTGFHDVVITRSHNKAAGRFSAREAHTLFQAWQDRYRVLAKDSCVQYVSIFENHGHEAGASVYHPHSQIIALPVVPPHIAHSLAGSLLYQKKHRVCVHCRMLAFEKKDKERIIYENKEVVVIAPFASRLAFEMKLFPKRHASRFEDARPELLSAVADAFHAVLSKLDRGLKNPPYNSFIHTAPAKGGAKHDHYHWHIEIFPKTSIWAGFEIGTGIEISTIAPEEAAKFLRSITI
jgi:UDPglucose--hexose-1-phosphate uridylyltransferase